ncbi:glycosyltransferase family 4 protein [Candidatus Fermentibacterales bacterium]|nr:glycosyltransferase family 4 protein [Candidatus Fermentibacterales bacterium]
MFHHLPSGGGIRVLSQNLLELVRRGCLDLHVHAPERAACLDPDPGLPFTSYPFPAGRRISGIRRALAPLALIARLRRFDGLCRVVASSMEERDPDLALVHNSMLIAAPPLLRHLSIPSVYVCYEYPRHIYEPGLVRRAGIAGRALLAPLRAVERRLDRAACESASRVVAISGYMAARIRATYRLGAAVAVARPGVDTGFFRPGSSWRAGSGVLSIGALWPFKGHETVIRALGELPAASRPALTIAADRELPGYACTLSRLAASCGVDLTIHRGIPDDRLRELYLSSGVVVCAQRGEPYGLVPLEAMACARPVVAVDDGGFSENVRSGVTGVLIPAIPGAVAEAVAAVLADPARAESLGRAGRQFVLEERTVARCVDDLIEAMHGAGGRTAGELPGRGILG